MIPCAVIWILVSDSSCALITGRRHTLKKYDLSEHFQQRKPGYVSEFIHEMLWGKTLQRLFKRGINFVLDALPVSYQENVAEITKLLFGESRRHIIPVGKSFTVEDVKALQPDTEDFLDVKNLAPGMFATPPKGRSTEIGRWRQRARSFRPSLNYCSDA